MTTNSVFQLKRNQHYLLLLLLLGLLYFPLFHHIAQLPLRIWDEARLAHNAYEMYKEGHVLVPHFEGKPDMWNLKPPFLVWMQAAFMHMLGPGELAVRLPSALAGLLTCLSLFFFFERRLSMPWAGFMAAMVLVTTQGFVHQHATRTGDYDAM
nr:glycosyltransferase family 39 protein [Lentimicrobiaceae bacterium]